MNSFSILAIGQFYASYDLVTPGVLVCVVSSSFSCSCAFLFSSAFSAVDFSFFHFLKLTYDLINIELSLSGCFGFAISSSCGDCLETKCTTDRLDP